MRLKILLAALALLIVASGSFLAAYVVLKPKPSSEIKFSGFDKLKTATESASKTEKQPKEDVKGVTTQETTTAVKPQLSQSSPVQPPTLQKPPDESNKIAAMESVFQTMVKVYQDEAGVLSAKKYEQERFTKCLNEQPHELCKTILDIMDGYSKRISQLETEIKNLKSQLVNMLANCQTCTSKYNDIQVEIVKFDNWIRSLW